MLLFALLACRPPAPAAPGPQSSPTLPTAFGEDSGDAGETWTVLVFMNGDNNLEGYVIHDLNELEAGGSGGGVRVLVQADRSPGYDDADGDWTGTRRYEIVGDDDLAQVTSPFEEVGELDMGDPAVLADFLAWGLATAPADHVMLALWDHGDGWTAAPAAAPPPPAISSDDTSHAWISIAEGELAEALDPLVAARGPIDLLAFDACYMGSFEVAYAMRHHAHTLLASEAWVGGEGLLYTPLLQALRADPSADIGLLADEAALRSVEEGAERTFSATDLRQMDGVAAALDELAVWGAADPAALQVALRDARGADPDWPKWYLDLRDLGAVAGAAGGPDALPGAMDGAVIGAYGNHRYDWSGGLTIFGDPEDTDALDLYTHGAGAVWSQDTRWDEALATLAPL